MIEKPSVRFVLQNRRTKVFCDPEVQIELKKYFRFHPEGYFFHPKYRLGLWDGWIQMLQRGYVSTGLLLTNLEELKTKFDVTVVDQRVFPNFQGIPKDVMDQIKEEREFQFECLLAMQKASNTGGLVIAATGVGKTLMAALYFSTLQGVAVFIVDDILLLEQSCNSLKHLLGEEIGVVGMGIFQPGRITVATVQSLHKHRDKAIFQDWFRTVQVALVDEVHVQINKRNIDVLDTIEPLAVFGLTATLQLQKAAISTSAMALTGPIIFSYSMQKGIEEGHLSKGVIIRVRITQSGEGGDWQASYKQDVVYSKLRNKCATELAKAAVAQKWKVLLFAERIIHLNILSKRLEDTPHAVISGEHVKKREGRLAYCRQMDEGSLSLIITNKVFQKGVDVPAANFSIDATGASSLNNTNQRLGRLTRKKEGKIGFVHVDIVDKSPTSDKESDLYNRFGVAGRRRLKALKTLGLPILNIDWNGDAVDVVARAEQFLQKHLRRNKILVTNLPS